MNDHPNVELMRKVYDAFGVGDVQTFAIGFEDPAYFSRVYAAATGLSPRTFREQLHGGE